MRSGAGMGFGKGGGSGGIDRDGYDRDESSNLIGFKDVKLPVLTADNPSAQVFRLWWKDLSKYCQRREKHWKAADSLFHVIRGYPNDINDREVPTFLISCTTRDHDQNIFDVGTWQVWDRMRELYTCVEYALGGKCADVFGGVKAGDGFELLRRLARKFDPVSPQAASIFKGRIYGLSGTPCATFAKTVERLRELERMRSDMRDQTGEDMDTKVLADIYFPTMDASCQSEIVALRIKIGVGQSAHDIDIANFHDLCEYVRDRIHRVTEKGHSYRSQPRRWTLVGLTRERRPSTGRRGKIGERKRGSNGDKHSGESRIGTGIGWVKTQEEIWTLSIRERVRVKETGNQLIVIVASASDIPKGCAPVP